MDLNNQLDQYRATASDPLRTEAYVSWITKDPRAAPLHAPAQRGTDPGGHHHADRRWRAARRLIHRAAIPIADQPAGPLAMLLRPYINAITRLMLNHVQRDPAVVSPHAAAAPGHLPVMVEQPCNNRVDRTKPRSPPGPGRIPPVGLRAVTKAIPLIHAGFGDLDRLAKVAADAFIDLAPSRCLIPAPEAWRRIFPRALPPKYRPRHLRRAGLHPSPTKRR
jgi:hypothetical protein